MAREQSGRKGWILCEQGSCIWGQFPLDSAQVLVLLSSIQGWFSSCRAQDVGMLREMALLFVPTVPVLSAGVWDNAQTLSELSPLVCLVDQRQILSRWCHIYSGEATHFPTNN